GQREHDQPPRRRCQSGEAVPPAPATVSPEPLEQRQRRDAEDEQVAEKPEMVPREVAPWVEPIEEVRVELEEGPREPARQPALQVDLRWHEQEHTAHEGQQDVAHPLDDERARIAPRERVPGALP